MSYEEKSAIKLLTNEKDEDGENLLEMVLKLCQHINK